MSRQFIATVCLVTSSVVLHPSSFAQRLPAFEDFRRADRERRETGQLHTTESIVLMRVDPKLLDRVARENRDDPQLVLGLAELRGNWTAPPEVSGTNAVVALRFACASAIKRDYQTALRWFRSCQTNDAGNVVPWLGELWVLRQQNTLTDAFHTPEGATECRDYAVPAARARVRGLEKAGYTPYAARRIALMQNTFVESMAQDLSRDPVAQPTASFLLNVARTMQRHPTFLLTELVGQTLERAALARRPNANQEEIETRIEELDDRRQELQQLVSNTERSTVGLATEQQMVSYFDNVLAIGEEAAMKGLARDVRRGP